uniref:Cystatin domain-containing protein n=1 Tax=Kalanchoe fedtschenkoi TaxID=63787 RepID=A0A7N0UR42_KALFE
MNFKAQLIFSVCLLANAAYALSYIQDESLIDLNNNANRWVRITNLEDPHVITIAKFAVKTHRREAGIYLKFSSVVTGYRQVGEGMKYRLIIRAENVAAETMTNYETLVHEQDAKNHKNLIYFRRALANDIEE